ncbi:MAG: RecQ family ATP-dependent DNA helicase [Patescibacteria group bacterium]|nr:ATP-dependent DNA helicase RecQ [bacterium]HQC49661.1 ATP-dependent DNA helicase RecQ [bacterium]
MVKKKQQLVELLKIHFGYNSFRPGQEKAIDSILRGQDTMVVLPTGGGKSLVFQLPALVMEGVTIVISPLIALMKDQVDSLEKVGIPATFINSAISTGETLKRLAKIKAGFFKLVYIAPERFYNRTFLNDLKNIKVSLFAIDEAHCISQWGHDFRPSYLRLKEAIKLVGTPPVVALTATATIEVREDIIKQLGLKEPTQIITGFARQNLQLAVIPSSNGQKIENILNFLTTNPNIGAGIIYTGTRAKADEILELLIEHDIKAVSYHAGMDQSSRDWVQEQFMKGEAQVVVATNAFGLGINKHDIRFVIHHDLPGTIEAYYQEAGRAGRDGLPSFCLLFYNQQDRYLREFFIKGDNPDPRIIIEIYDFLLHKLELEIDQNNSLLITYAEIAQNLSESVPEMAIGTALKILEREGYISRPNDKNSNSFVKAKKPLREIIESSGKRARTQKEVLEKLLDRYESELMNGWEFVPEEVAIVLKIKKDSLVRVIKKLAEKDLFIYRPPFRGTEIKILKIVEPEDLDLDFKSLKEKAARAYEKLDEMENYVYHLGCRQEYILKYFGDEESAWSCGKCDGCLRGKNHRLVKNNQPPNKNNPHHEYLINS